MRAPARGVRARLLLAVVASVALGLVVLGVCVNVVLAQRVWRDADLVLRARADAESSALGVEGARLVPAREHRGASIETRAWIYSGGRLVQWPRTAPELHAAAAALAGGPQRRVDVQGADVRLLALPVVEGGRRLGTVVSGISTAPYRRTLRRAAVASAAGMALALLGVALASWWLLRSALRPVDRMTASAAAWSEVDLDRRLGEGHGRDELGRLAETLDGLLDRIAASLRRERAFTAEVSHELRTPLAQIAAEADLALRRERDADAYRAALEAIRAGAWRLHGTLEALVAGARAQVAAERRGTADAAEAAARAVAACAALADARGVRLDLDLAPGASARVGVEPELVQRILAPVLENACRYARARVVVAVPAAVHSAGIAITVADDGSGVAEEEREAIFMPGVRGSAGRRGEGSGLGLSLARRLARGVAGEVEAVPDASGGRFVVRLPSG